MSPPLNPPHAEGKSRARAPEYHRSRARRGARPPQAAGRVGQNPRRHTSVSAKMGQIPNPGLLRPPGALPNSFCDSPLRR